MTPSDRPDILPETAAAERLRQHLEEIAHERDRAHRALQEREAELARIQRIARVGGLEIDFRDGVKNRRSPEYLLVHGLPPEDPPRRPRADDQAPVRRIAEYERGLFGRIPHRPAQ